MFVTAIEKAACFTRPIHSIVRYYGSSDVHPGAATLFFVNDQGWALTCKHVAAELAGSEELASRFNAFKGARAAIKGQKKERQLLNKLETQHGFQRGSVVEVKNTFMNCVDKLQGCQILVHQTLDIALLKFDGFTKLGCTIFPVFAANPQDLKQGKSLCRLGFPFPEFTNFAYDAASDSIDWTNAGKSSSPSFPIEGMVTRLVGDATGNVVGFELSTPGLRGQSGGPAFDIDGRIWGMQSATNHLDLNFDVDAEVVRGGKKQRVKDHAFLHVGRAIHVSQLKDFMKTHNVAFQEG